MPTDPLFFIFGIVYLLVILVIFLILRQFVLWYFRLNQIADDLATIADHYRRQDQTAIRPSAYPAPRPAISTPPVKPLTPTQDAKLRRGWE